MAISSISLAKDAAFQIVDTASVGFEISNPISGEVCKEGDEPLHVCRPGLEVNLSQSKERVCMPYIVVLFALAEP